MFDWQDFDTVFQPKPDFAFDNKTVESVLKHRKEFGDQLFFDRIWKSIGLTRPSRNNYPPRTNQDLRNLWSKIVQSPAADEQKLALLYYVLRDCRQLSNADTNFARRTYLPQKYQLLVAGLWELDHAQFSRALEHLTDPCLTPTFADEILLALIHHPKCQSSLATAYYITVSPPLKHQSTLEAYFDLVLANNIVQAYYFAKKQGKQRHKTLFEKIIVAVHKEKPGATRAERASLLLGLPFTAEEEAWFEECLLSGAGSKLPNAKDSVMARNIATGRSISGENGLSRLKGENIGGITWDTVVTGIADAVPH
ncbi:nuclear pore complex assembly-domain-containing protein [Exophiala viscosa]|uniref:nuclear pore complex assembly-domain-containing protein n=1 Tax=Exophiala viscosa TaxID=2486360 RepID=UPI002198A6F6|nr:nuclear pore complex assembly-domain-containing protein [Exophiala viscosa]